MYKYFVPGMRPEQNISGDARKCIPFDKFYFVSAAHLSITSSSKKREEKHSETATDYVLLLSFYLSSLLIRFAFNFPL